MGKAHTQPLASVSVSACSNLTYSLLAAAKICFIITGSPASTATKAAFTSSNNKIAPPASAASKIRRRFFCVSPIYLEGNLPKQVTARLSHPYYLGTLHSEGQGLIGHPVRVPPQDLQGCDRYLFDKLSILRGTISPVVVSPNNIGSCGRINLPVSTQRSSC